MARWSRQSASPSSIVGPWPFAKFSILATCWLSFIYKMPAVSGMRLSRPWTEKHWCESVIEPEWPFAYQKFPGHEFEKKGRTNSNLYVTERPWKGGCPASAEHATHNSAPASLRRATHCLALCCSVSHHRFFFLLP